MSSFAKICSREMTKKFIRENKFSRKLIPLRYPFTFNHKINDDFKSTDNKITDLIF